MTNAPARPTGRAGAHSSFSTAPRKEPDVPTRYAPRDPKAARLDQAHPVHPRRQLEQLGARPEWMLRAVCRLRPAQADDFFPDVAGRGAAFGGPKAVCRSCPVTAECLQFALDGREAYGLWGGLTTPERDRLLESRRVGA